MAKRRARGEFNMSEAIREQLRANPNLSLRECREAIAAANPGLSINTNSFGVAFSNQRNKLGLKPRRRGRKVRMRKPAQSAPRNSAGAGGSVRIEHLQAARKFMAEVGDADTAISAVRALAQLQIG